MRTSSSLSMAFSAAFITSVQAAGFQVSEQNVSGLGSVFAGQAALGEDASAVYVNPAQLPRLGPARFSSSAGFAYIKPRSVFVDEGSCAPYAGAGAGTSACPFGSNGNLGHINGGAGRPLSKGEFVPFAYMAWRVTDAWHAGLGLSAPFGLATDRPAAWVGRFHAIESQTETQNLNLATAWQPPALPLSFGVGINAQRLSAHLSSAVSYGSAALQTQSPLLIAAVPPGTEGTVAIDGHDWGWGWNAGLDIDLARMLQLRAPLNVAVAYRSRVRHELRGEIQFQNRPAAFQAVPALAAALGDGSATAKATLPDTLSIAGAWTPRPDWTVLADYTRTGWDSLQDLSIVRTDGPLQGATFSTTPFRFRDSWRTGVGAIWRPSPGWSMRAGVAYESAATVDLWRTARLPDQRRLFVGAGARLPVPSSLLSGTTVDIGLAWSKYASARVALPNQATAQSLPEGSLVGRFETRALIGGMQLNVAF